MSEELAKTNTEKPLSNQEQPEIASPYSLFDSVSSLSPETNLNTSITTADGAVDFEIRENGKEISLFPKGSKFRWTEEQRCRARDKANQLLEPFRELMSDIAEEERKYNKYEASMEKKITACRKTIEQLVAQREERRTMYEQQRSELLKQSDALRSQIEKTDVYRVLRRIAGG